MAIRADDLPHFTPATYRRLVDASPEELRRTELIDGVIYTLSPTSYLHGRAVSWIGARLELKYPGRVASGVTVEFPTSQWEPDICVVRDGANVDETSANVWLTPDQVALAVEVSLSSQSRDLGPKLRDYARAGVPAYWVVNPSEGGWMLAHGDPHDGTYRSIHRVELPAGYRDLEAWLTGQQ